MSNWDFYSTHFAAARLRHYEVACKGDRSRAQALYRWNTAVSSAFWADLAYFEVALRNAIDDRMSTRHARLERSSHWIFDDARELGREKGKPKGDGTRLHKQPYLDIHTAIGRVRHNGMLLTPDQVVSEISFGFWHQMVSQHQTALWPDLAGAFPFAPSRDQRLVREPVERLRSLRNRVGHHHRIYNLDLQARAGDLLDVAGFIAPELRQFIDERSRVNPLLAQRP